MFQMLTIGLGVEQKGPRISFFHFFYFIFFFFFFFVFFFKKLDVGRVYQDEELSLTQQPLTNSKSTKNMRKLAVK